MTNSERDKNIEILKKMVLGLIEYITIKNLFDDQTNQFVKDTSIILKKSVSIDCIVNLWQKMKQILYYCACGVFDNVFYYELGEKETGLLNKELLTQIDELQIKELDCKDFYLLLKCFSRADCVAILSHVPSNNHAMLTTKGIEYILNQDYSSFEELMFHTNADIALPSINLQKLALKNKSVFNRLFEFEIQNKLNEIRSIDIDKNTDLSNFDYPYPSYISDILTADDEKCEYVIVDDDLYLSLMDLHDFLKNFSEFGRSFLNNFFQELSIVVYQVELHNGLESSSPHDFFINFHQRCLNEYLEMSRSRLNLVRTITLPPIEDRAFLCRNDDTEKSDSESLSTVSIDEEESDLMNEDDLRPSPPAAILKRRRLRNRTLITKLCTHMQKEFFSNANIQDIMYLFFGEGKRPEKSLILNTTQSDLSNMISYITGNKRLSRETWMFYGYYIIKDNKPVIPLEREHKDWISNPPSGWAQNKLDFPRKIEDTLRTMLGRDLTKEEQEDLK